MDKNAKKRKSVNRAIERLATLLENGQLLAATDPAAMLDMASDTIETLQRRLDEKECDGCEYKYYSKNNWR